MSSISYKCSAILCILVQYQNWNKSDHVRGYDIESKLVGIQIYSLIIGSGKRNYWY